MNNQHALQKTLDFASNYGMGVQKAKQLFAMDRRAVADATARSLSCPECGAQPGDYCTKPFSRRKRKRDHEIRRIKAEWVIDNAGESN